ncbi:Cof-type HAD-IIB family hydrolase [Lactiplantibacillus xiangfangensis]|uniref:Cof-type HAD-IIB family hydrolase n=1 Tax=Lactiplantibacillus xiangfangensis TaxID=942150 RepID=UPI00070F64B9|nr:Cof-type HAD-IIB family hydrolase [Lactiplantibacillus xiangfangensis]
MQNKIVAACFDLDGTLLDSNGRISPANVSALQSLNQNGIAVVLASGRPIESLALFSQDVLHLDTFKIGFNGAIVANQHGKVLAMELINNQDVIEVTRLAQQLGINVNFSTPTKWINFSVQVNDDRVDKYNETLTEIRCHSLAQLQLLMDDRPIKVLKVGMHIVDQKKLWVMKAAMQGMALNVVQSDREFLEATRRGISKYSGFQQLGKVYKWQADHALVFGDYENDYELIQRAKYGVAMANGLAKLKSVAWQVAPTNDEDGVAQIINKYDWVMPVKEE